MDRAERDDRQRLTDRDDPEPSGPMFTTHEELTRHAGEDDRQPLPELDDPEPSGFVFNNDEELSRSSDIGRITHAVIAELAALTRRPTIDQVLRLVDDALPGFAAIEARAHRQNIRGLTHRYFTSCCPPPRFIFGGAELDLGAGRPDLVWFDFDGFVLVDEVKTGGPRTLHVSSTTEQVERYRLACLSVWGDHYLGLRLLCPADPAESLFIYPTGSRVPLCDTPYLMGVDRSLWIERG